MTDKQIIENKNGFYCIEPCSEIKQLKEQLIRKEQECEELTSKCSQLEEKYARLEKDNLEEHANWCDTKWSIQWRNIALIEENKKLKQTLSEIKEIAERGLNYSQCSCGAKADLDLILQKINEVENEG